MTPHAIIVAIAIYLFLTADSMTSFSCFMFGANLIVLTNMNWMRRKPAVVHLLIRPRSRLLCVPCSCRGQTWLVNR